MPIPSDSWIRQAIVALVVIIAAFLIGYISGNWRLDGYAKLESIYVCNNDGSIVLQPQASHHSVLYICGTVSGNIKWGAGMYIYHDVQVVLSKSVQFPPGDFLFSLPIESNWPIGKYKIEFARAQNVIATIDFELIPN